MEMPIDCVTPVSASGPLVSTDGEAVGKVLYLGMAHREQEGHSCGSLHIQSRDNLLVSLNPLATLCMQLKGHIGTSPV